MHHLFYWGARGRYRELFDQTEENDLTAELYLFSVLADYDLTGTYFQNISPVYKLMV